MDAFVGQASFFSHLYTPSVGTLVADSIGFLDCGPGKSLLSHELDKQVVTQAACQGPEMPLLKMILDG